VPTDCKPETKWLFWSGCEKDGSDHSCTKETCSIDADIASAGNQHYNLGDIYTHDGGDYSRAFDGPAKHALNNQDDSRFRLENFFMKNGYVENTTARNIAYDGAKTCAINDADKGKTYRQKTVMYQPWGFNVQPNDYGSYAPNHAFTFTDNSKTFVMDVNNGNGGNMDAPTQAKARMCDRSGLSGGISDPDQTKKSFNKTTNEWTEWAYCNDHACHDLDEAAGDSSKTCLQGVTCKKVNQKILDDPAGDEQLNRNSAAFTGALDGANGTDAWLNSCSGHALSGTGQEIESCSEKRDDAGVADTLSGRSAECNLNCHHCTEAVCQHYAAEGSNFERVRVTHIQGGLTNTDPNEANEHRFHCSIADRDSTQNNDCRCRCNKHRKCCARKDYILADTSAQRDGHHEGSNYIAGNIYENFVGDQQECCNLCINHPDCKAWEWIKLSTTGQRVCALKNTKEELVPMNNPANNSVGNYITSNITEYAKPYSLAPATTIEESYAGRLNVLGDPGHGVRHDNCTDTETDDY